MNINLTKVRLKIKLDLYGEMYHLIKKYFIIAIINKEY